MVRAFVDKLDGQIRLMPAVSSSSSATSRGKASATAQHPHGQRRHADDRRQHRQRRCPATASLHHVHGSGRNWQTPRCVRRSTRASWWKVPLLSSTRRAASRSLSPIGSRRPDMAILIGLIEGQYRPAGSTAFHPLRTWHADRYFRPLGLGLYRGGSDPDVVGRLSAAPRPACGSRSSHGNQKSHTQPMIARLPSPPLWGRAGEGGML